MNIKLIPHLIRNMGWRYLIFRFSYEMKQRLGWLKRQHPTKPNQKFFISLEDWRKKSANFFFSSKAELDFPQKPHAKLKQTFDQFLAGELTYFNAIDYHIGKDFDWLTNPSNGYRYDLRHWTEIPDFSPEAGDIKYVWEKSRFGYLYAIIRYDYHFGEDCAELVFAEIDSWISANPINQGPNWRCSQELSLRVLNWTFALSYYKGTSSLTEERFQRIMHTIYWHLCHIYQNINFSRIAVRNNHALTETLMLYLGGILFPFFPGAAQWKRRGKAWFEQEIKYQIYEDGTFLQFSHNYHRVTIQLLSWAFYLARSNGERFSDLVYQRAHKSLDYLYQCTQASSGHLPNYGANDGALFFSLNNCDYRDYRPQLNALSWFLDQKMLFTTEETWEDSHWYSPNMPLDKPTVNGSSKNALTAFPVGGYYLIQDSDSLSFIKCGSYKDRPAQADNLHIDIWYQGKNLLRDSGTYRYNTSAELVQYFNGTSAHNTVCLGDYDQMQKGPRFIWLHWSQADAAKLWEEADRYYFQGTIRAFGHLHSDIKHTRTIIKQKGLPIWEIIDELSHPTELPIRQYWHPAPEASQKLKITAIDATGNTIDLQPEPAYFSDHYGVKEETEAWVFETYGNIIKTSISIK